MAESYKPRTSELALDTSLGPVRACGPVALGSPSGVAWSRFEGDTPGPLGINDYATPEALAAVAMDVLISSRQTQSASHQHGKPAAAQAAKAASAAPASSATGTKITTALLLAADSTNLAKYYDGLVDAMNTYAAAYAINTPLRIAHFLSQIGTESGFRMVQEQGAYTAKRMREIFGCKGGASKYVASKDDCQLGRLRDKLWTDEKTYVHNPKNLLSYVYANRLGNGDEASGDGYKYRGRGMIQLTGKSNYQKFTDTHNQKNPKDTQDFVQSPDLLVSEQRYGIESAFFFWNSGAINAIADGDDVEKVTRAVNGGLNGLADRKARLAKLKQALGI